MNVPVSITASGAHPGVAAPALPVAGRRPRITLTVMPFSLGALGCGVDYVRGKGGSYARVEVSRGGWAPVWPDLAASGNRVDGAIDR
jgi:hypothetical protein